MTVHDPGPYFTVVNYHSPYGVHKQLLCHRAWSPPTGGSLFGLITNWNDVQIDAGTMIEDLVTLEAAMQPNTVVWDGFTIYYKPTPADLAAPVAFGSLAVTGTSVLAGWFAAVTHTFNMLDTAFNATKLVIIEASSGGDFGRVLPAAFSAAQMALIAEFTDEDKGWASRAGLRPNVCRNITKDLNDKLRKEYNIG